MALSEKNLCGGGIDPEALPFNLKNHFTFNPVLNFSKFKFPTGIVSKMYSKSQSVFHEMMQNRLTFKLVFFCLDC